MQGYGDNAKAIYRRLYLLPNESIEDCHWRVARALASSDEEAERFKQLLDEQVVRLNTPCMINAGTSNGECWHACFILGLEDSMDSIIEMWEIVARIYKGGGGCGIPIGNLRHKGAPISSGGHASGPLSYLHVVQAIADSVRSGGRSRRAANIATMPYQHPDIFDFINCKGQSGTTFQAFNLSVLVDDEFFQQRSEASQSSALQELWEAICTKAWECGDPGLLFHSTVNRYNYAPWLGEIRTTNPCLRATATVATPRGIRCIGDINEGDIIWSGQRWTKVIGKWYRGVKPVYRFVTTAGVFEGTLDHKIVCRGEKIPVGQADAIDTNTVEHGIDQLTRHKPQAVMDGLVVGDGTYCKSSGKILLYVGQNDQDYFDSEIKDLIWKRAKGNAYKVSTTIEWLPRTYERYVPEYYFKADFYTVCSFLRGLFSANGSVIHERVTLKQSSRKLIEQVQQMLSFVGIRSYITTNKGKKIKFRNGIYECKTSYDLNIYADKDRFYRLIGFIQQYKMEKLRELIENQQYKGNSKTSYEIVDIQYLGDFPVYDITVEAPEHTYWTGGLLVGNCGEVAGPPWTVCCLGHINLVKCLEGEAFSFEKLKAFTRDTVWMLNRILDRSPYPHKRFEEVAKSVRPIGVGLMGFADLLYILRIPYDSGKAVQLFSKICRSLTRYAFEASAEYAAIEGCVAHIPPEHAKHAQWLQRYYANRTFDQLANLTVTCIAPTGSTALSADCSYSFEPHFAIVWEKLLDDGSKMRFVNPHFLEACAKEGINITDQDIDQIIEHKGSIQELSKLPGHIRQVFECAHDIHWKDRLQMQAAGQRYITQSISSTVNLPNSATIEDVMEIYETAWKLGLKGITVFRDGCLDSQPVQFGKAGKAGKAELCLKQERPQELEGRTYKLKTGNGTLYLTLNELNGKPFEVFVTIGKSGRDTAANAEAIGRLVSLCLRSGIPLEEVVRQLEGIGGESPIFQNGTLIKSVPDAIANILLKHCSASACRGEASAVGLCPQCGSPMRRDGSCRGGTCVACGYSKCC